MDLFKEIVELKKRSKYLKEKNKKFKVEMIPYRVWIWGMMILAVFLAYNF